MAREIDDDVGPVHGLMGKALGGEAFGRIAIGGQRFGGGPDDVSERSEAGAGGVAIVGSVVSGDRFSHGAAAGVTDADEESAELLARGHVEILAPNV